MDLDAFDQSPPPFFRQDGSRFSRLLVLLALSVLLVVSDTRWSVTQAVRQILQTAIAPVQWVLNQPLNWVHLALEYGQGLEAARTENFKLRRQLLRSAQTTARYDDLLAENAHLKRLLNLKNSYPQPGARVAQVLQETADPFSHKVMLSKGSLDNIVLGSPVLDMYGVAGQVTRVFPFSSELTLIDDPSFIIPVMNTRTGNRGVAVGSLGSTAGNLELRFSLGSADIQTGDILSTSGIDGIYPSGLVVAEVVKIDREASASLSKVYLRSLSQSNRGRHVLILDPQPIPVLGTTALPPTIP